MDYGHSCKMTLQEESDPVLVRDPVMNANITTLDIYAQGLALLMLSLITRDLK